MELTLQTNGWGSLFGVPTAVVDRYLKLATPSQLKVLLYLLRHSCTTISVEQTAQALAISTDLVEEAMLFWEQTDLFAPTAASQRQTEAASVVPSPSVPEVPAATVQKPPVAVMQRSSSEVKLTPSEIAAELQNNSGMMELFRMAEQLVGEPLTHMQQKSLFWQYEYLSLSVDIILTVLSYCYSIGKGSVGYEEKLILSWWNQGLTTMQQINDAIVQDQNSRSYYSLIARTLDMNRPPTAKQRSFFDQWQKLNLPIDLIRYAYEKTVEQTDKLSLPYMNKILEAWAAAGYRNREDVDTNDRLEQKSDAIKKKRGTTSQKKKEEIPESPMADAYRSLICNIDE
jgi:DnaD/phage-associated family protein